MPKPKITAKPGKKKLSETQKQAIGIGGATIAGYFLWRYEQGKQGGTPVTAQPTGQSTASFGQLAPYTPQAPLVLQPGESVYDPNQGGLMGPAGGGGIGGTGGSASQQPPLSGPAPITQATNPGQPLYTINVKYPAAVSSKRKTVKPVKRTVKARPPVRKPKKPIARHHA